MSRKEDDPSIFEVSSSLLTLMYIYMLTVSGLILLVLSLFWGDDLLRSFSDITSGEVSGEGIKQVWFIFAWALVATAVLIVIQGPVRTYESRIVCLAKGVWASLNAGIFEEIIFRWILFFTAMITLPFLNFITFGLLKIIYEEILIPVANFCTLGALDGYLAGSSWVLGAAIISVNADFRDGHSGFIGKINSWFIGMVMFYLMLNYNLQTAIVAHVIYDIIVFTFVAVTTQNKPHRMRVSRR